MLLVSLTVRVLHLNPDLLLLYFSVGFLILMLNLTSGLQSELNAALSNFMCSVPVNCLQVGNGTWEGCVLRTCLFGWFQGSLDAPQLFPWQCIC